MRVKFYGCRGSMPFFGGGNVKYGGNTCCAAVRTGGRTIVLDCGSGLAGFANELSDSDSCVDILIGHLHLDHIVGLCMFAPLYAMGVRVRIFTANRMGGNLKDQVFGVFKPPYWPVDMRRTCNAEVIEVYSGVPFTLGDVRVVPFPLNHPNGSMGFRIEADKALVYMTDHEAGMPESARAAEFAANADMVVHDCQYLDSDYPKHRGWGHTSFGGVVSAAKEYGCGKMVFTHFSQKYSDQALDAEYTRVTGGAAGFIMAREGLDIEV